MHRRVSRAFGLSHLPSMLRNGQRLRTGVRPLLALCFLFKFLISEYFVLLPVYLFCGHEGGRYKKMFRKHRIHR